MAKSSSLEPSSCRPVAPNATPEPGPLPARDRGLNEFFLPVIFRFFPMSTFPMIPGFRRLGWPAPPPWMAAQRCGARGARLG